MDFCDTAHRSSNNNQLVELIQKINESNLLKICQTAILRIQSENCSVRRTNPSPSQTDNNK